MRIRSALVTGATGFLGQALVRRLLAENIETVCLVRSQSASQLPAEFRRVRVVENPSFAESDLRRSLAGVSCEVVFNLASYGVRQEDRDPQLLIEGNVGILSGLLQVTASWGLTKFVHAGSCSQYGLSGERRPISEDFPLRPASLYGAAKAAAELYGDSLAAHVGVPFVTLRIFGVYGIGEAPYRLVPYIIHRLQQEKPVDLTPGEQERDLLYIDDLVEALWMASQCPQLRPGSAWNVCSGRAVRIRDVGQAVAAAMRKPPSLLLWGKRAYRPDEPMWLVGDNQRFLCATSWQPTVTLQDGIARLIEATTGKTCQL